MEHLSDDRLIELARGRGSPEEREHLKRCAHCRNAAASWRRWLRDLAGMESEQLSGETRHALRTLFSELGPKRHGGWLAGLAGRATREVLAIRGAPAIRMEEREGGPYRFLLQLRPAGEGTFDVHVMVRHAGEGGVGGSRVVLAAPESVAHVTRLDRFGEIHLAGLPAGRYRLVFWLPEGRVEIPALDVGDGDAD